jgi:CheY-like chemotaxis protein
MLRRLSISARLLVLSVTLLVIIVGSNLYFTAALREVAGKAADADRVVRQIQVADSVRTAFGDLRYWRTDVALSLLMMSQRNADTARQRLDQQLERLATVNADITASLRQEVAAFDALAEKAADAYTADQRVIGNSLFAQARQHSLKGDPDLASIPVVLVTANQDRSLGFELGAVAFLTKPIDRDALLDAIRRCSSGAARGIVLVVEDESETRELTERTVEKLGYSAAHAANGRLALSWLESNRPPILILLDLLMPEMDGFAFLERLRSQPETHGIPVIVVTAKELTAEEQQWLGQTTQRVIAKGQSAHVDLSQAVRAVLARAAPAPAE